MQASLTHLLNYWRFRSQIGVKRWNSFLLPCLLLSFGCTKTVSICIPNRVLSTAAPATAATAATWSVEHVITVGQGYWTSNKIAFAPAPTNTNGPILPPPETPTAEPVHCAKFEKGHGSVTKSIKIFAKAPGNSGRYVFKATLEIDAVPESNELRFFLGDNSLPPYCGWTGKVELKRNETPLASMFIWPPKKATKLGEVSWSGCLDVEPKPKDP